MISSWCTDVDVKFPWSLDTSPSLHSSSLSGNWCHNIDKRSFRWTIPLIKYYYSPDFTQWQIRKSITITIKDKSYKLIWYEILVVMLLSWYFGHRFMFDVWCTMFKGPEKTLLKTKKLLFSAKFCFSFLCRKCFPANLLAIINVGHKSPVLKNPTDDTCSSCWHVTRAASPHVQWHVMPH